MVIQTSIASAVTSAVGFGLMNYMRQRESRRLGRQLLIEGLHQASMERQPAPCSPQPSEMEVLLDAVGKAAAALLQALAAEEQLKDAPGMSNMNSPDLVEQWQMTRSLTEQAQRDYYQAVGQDREFVHSLAPPLRPKAAARGCVAMTLARA